MGKPWHPYEQNFINHPKFLVLSAGAVCLWLEGKNYCDVHLTDGMIPREALRTFRFNSRTRVDELQRIIDGYSGPLWEDHAVGFKMRDYLDHNPCRERVLAKIERAEDERQQDRERKAEWRRQKAELRRNRPANVPVGQTRDRDGTATHLSRSLTETETEQKEQVPPPRDSRSKRPLFTGQRFTVFEWQVDDLTRMLGSHTDAFDLHAWFFDLDAHAVKAGQVIPQRDGGKWLQAQLLVECARRQLPMFDAQRSGRPEPKSTVPDVERTAAYLRKQREL